MNGGHALKSGIKSLLGADRNLRARRDWLEKTLAALPADGRILDAGAGELQNKPLCDHLRYESQDFCQYSGQGEVGLHTGTWDTCSIDIVSDITSIPRPDCSYDAVLCSEVLEHVYDPLKVLDELARLTKPGGVLILTAPFASWVHMAPHFYATGFSRFWYRRALESRGFDIVELQPNGSWRAFLQQEIARLVTRHASAPWWVRWATYAYAGSSLLYLRFIAHPDDGELACFGWHCLARKRGVTGES